MIKRVLIIGFVLIILGLITFNYFYYAKCSNEECFTNSLIKCKKTYYLNEQENLIMNYKILGKNSDKCNVEVKILKIKLGNVDLINLENKGMICNLPLGLLTTPETNINDCHGELKEEMQNIIIKRMHTEIIENLGNINESLTKIL